MITIWVQDHAGRGQVQETGAEPPGEKVTLPLPLGSPGAQEPMVTETESLVPAGVLPLFGPVTVTPLEPVIDQVTVPPLAVIETEQLLLVSGA